MGKLSKEEIEEIIAKVETKDRENKKFVYNYQLANIAMKMGIKCLETGKSPQGNIFFVFDYNEIQPAYEVLTYYNEKHKKNFKVEKH